MVTNRDRKSFGSCRKNSKSCSDDWHRRCFWYTFRHFGTHIAKSFCMSKSSWMINPTCSREMPSCSAIDLAEIQQFSKIGSWIWSIISMVVTVLGRPGRGASQVEKSQHLHQATSIWWWHTMVHIPLMFLSEWHEFPSAPCLAGKKLYDSSYLNVVENARNAWHASFQLCNKKRLAIQHMNRPLFPTTLSIQSYDIGK